MPSEVDASRTGPSSLLASLTEPLARRVLFWLVVPLAALSLISVLTEALFGQVTLVSLFYNNAFGQGALAAIDALRVWFGQDWIRPDSWTPMLKALELVAGGTTALYDTLFFGERVKFQYPPTSLLPLDAMSVVLTPSPTVLNAINALVMLATALAAGSLAWLAFGRGAERAPIDARVAALLAFGAFWVFSPALQAFHLGQIQLWIDLLFTAACILWLMDRREAAGGVIAAACMIKPQLGLLLVWALLAREWGFAKGFLFVALPVGIISLGRYGWENHVGYLDVLSFISRHGESYYANNSVNGLLNRLLFNGPNLAWDPHGFAPYNTAVYVVTLATSLALVLAPLVLAFRRQRPANVLDLGAAALSFTIAAPIAWEHHYGIALPLFVLLLRAGLDEGDAEQRRVTLTLLTVSWVLSAGAYSAVNLLADTPLNVMQSYLFFGGLILLYLLLTTASRASWAHTGSATPGGGTENRVAGRAP